MCYFLIFFTFIFIESNLLGGTITDHIQEVIQVNDLIKQVKKKADLLREETTGSVKSGVNLVGTSTDPCPGMMRLAQG